MTLKISDLKKKKTNHCLVGSSSTCTLVLPPVSHPSWEAFHKGGDWGSWPCPAQQHWAQTPDPRGSMLRSTMLEHTAPCQWASSHTHVVWKNQVTEMHGIREITLNPSKDFPQYHFLFEQISFLVSNYFSHLLPLSSLLGCLYWIQEPCAFPLSSLNHPEFLLSFLKGER